MGGELLYHECMTRAWVSVLIGAVLGVVAWGGLQPSRPVPKNALEVAAKSMHLRRLPAVVSEHLSDSSTNKVVYIGIELSRCSFDRVLPTTKADPSREVLFVFPGRAADLSEIPGKVAKGAKLLLDEDRSKFSELIYMNAPLVLVVDPLGYIISVRRPPAVQSTQELTQRLLK